MGGDREQQLASAFSDVAIPGIREEPEVVSKKDKISIFDVLRNKFPKELTDVFPTVKIKYLYSP